ncbi:MAG: zinc ribbon domain-containing protein [Rhodocyclaceae bacterium]|nr:zinc ribbon domain-containing protein [Rhodocyclaceae bacterium]
MNCNACHQEIRPGSKFCPLCGAAQAEVTPCPTCGAELPPGKPFCPACGSDLQPEAAAPAAESGGFYQDYETTQAYPPAEAAEAAPPLEADRPGEAWQAHGISDIPDEPMSEMMLESDWNPESALSSFARRIEAEDASGPEAGLPAGSDEAPASQPPAADEVATPARKPGLFDLLLEAEAMRSAENGDPNATVIMRAPQAQPPAQTPPAATETAAPPPLDAVAEPPPDEPAPEEPVTEWSVETVRLRAEELEMPTQSPLEAAAPRSRRLVPLVIAIVAFVAAIGGGLAWWLSDRGGDRTAPQPEKVAPPPATPAPVPSVPMEPITPRPAEPAPGEGPNGSPSAGEPAPQLPAAEPSEPLPPASAEPQEPLEPPQEPAPPPPATDEPTAPVAAEPPPAKPKPVPKPKPAPRPKPKPAPEPEPEPPPPPVPEPAPPPPTPAVPAWLTTMRAELAVCDEKSFFAKAICREKVRWNHCAPDRWNTVPECAVKNQ